MPLLNRFLWIQFSFLLCLSRNDCSMCSYRPSLDSVGGGLQVQSRETLSAQITAACLCFPQPGPPVFSLPRPPPSPLIPVSRYTEHLWGSGSSRVKNSAAPSHSLFNAEPPPPPTPHPTPIPVWWSGKRFLGKGFTAGRTVCPGWFCLGRAINK